MGKLATTGRVLLALTVLVLQAAPAWADGGVLQATGVTTAVQVKAQRAVIWHKPDALELTIEPIFNWAGDGAWVIPLPALPEVSGGDPAFLSELDRATAPVFVEACIDYGCCCNGDCDVGGSIGGVGPATSAVTVWSSGQVGPLDYVVLSTTDGDSLVAWAETNGFVLSDAETAAIDELEIDGSYFFVARVAPDADNSRSLTPVTFRFSADVAPFYPVRFTGSLLPHGGHLDVVLWLVGEHGTGYEPVGIAFEPPNWYSDCSESYTGFTSNSYQSWLNSWFAGISDGGFISEFDAPITSAPGLVGVACPKSVGDCPSLPVIQLTSESMNAMKANNNHVTRLRGRLRGASLEADLAFLAVPEQYEEWNGVYCSTTVCDSNCYCPTEPYGSEVFDGATTLDFTTPNAADEAVAEAHRDTSGCAASSDPCPASALAVSLFLAGLGLAAWRRTRRSC